VNITRVSTVALGLPYEMGGPKPQFAGRTREVLDLLLVRVDTDAGITGWGEAFGYAVWPSTRTAIDKVIAPLAVGRDAGDIAGLMLDLQKKFHLIGRTGPVVYGLSGLDIALWDIAGKAAGNRPRCPRTRACCATVTSSSLRKMRPPRRATAIARSSCTKSRCRKFAPGEPPLTRP